MNFTDEDFKYKILNASPTRLVIVTYEIIQDRIDRAVQCVKAGDDKGLGLCVDNAKQYIVHLLDSIDTKAKVSREMIDLYLFVNKLIIKGHVKKDEKYFEDAKSIINRLKCALEKVVDDDASSAAPNFSDTYSKK